jgi:hypothetical protein
MIDAFQLALFNAAKVLFGHLRVSIQVSGMATETCQAECSIAKIISLIGPITRSEDPQFTNEFDLAEIPVQMDEFPTQCLEEELKPFGPEEDFVGSINSESRDTANGKAALEHSWLQGLG